MDVEPVGDRRGRTNAFARWVLDTNHNPNIVAAIRRARRALPGDPEFGDPLSRAGDGGVEVAARAADRLMPKRDGATREVSLAALQLWKAVTERVSGRQPDGEVTLVFTDLVGFSEWSLKVGDEVTLRLLRRVAQVAEPPLLDAGGHIVKRMGDGMMAVFPDAGTAVIATLTALRELKTVDVDGYTPQMRAGIHTGCPQHIGSDWLGVDVNIAARVMARATKGGLIVSEKTLEKVPEGELESMGVRVKRVRRNLFVARPSGVPADLVMYRLKSQNPGRVPKENAAAKVEEPKGIAAEGDSPHEFPADDASRDGTSSDAPTHGVPAKDVPVKGVPAQGTEE